MSTMTAHPALHGDAGCSHCGAALPAAQDNAAGPAFCCAGCEAAYALVQDQGLDLYYQRRCLDPATRPLRPDDDRGPVDYSHHTTTDSQGIASLNMMIEGLHCAACVWLIERLLSRQKGIVQGRVNMTTRRLALKWNAAETDAATLLEPLETIGYRLIPYDPAGLSRETDARERALLRAMAVAGFAAGNVMLLSISIWAGTDPITRDLFHWLSALIAMPAIVYCLRPFARSAVAALRAGRTNMDVPITLGVVLTAGMSLVETMNSGPHAYFDSAITLLFFLLIGRYLDSRARGRARGAAEHLVALGSAAATVIAPDGTRSVLPPSKLRLGMMVLVAAGERVAVDGRVATGRSDLDTSLITGETIPVAVAPGAQVFAGTLNLTAPVTLEITAIGEGTLLAEIVRMMESAEQGRARFVALADRVSRYYSPVVHVAALATFLAWTFAIGIAWQVALMHAVAVLIITCPCALALAVPVVQVIATGRLMRQGILVKTPTALERLRRIDTVIFDKTGTLTIGRPDLLRPEFPGRDGAWTDDDLAVAASLAAASRHPLARALVRAAPLRPMADDVVEVPGQGLQAGAIRLGSRSFLGIAEDGPATGPELWLARPGCPPVRFAFHDEIRADAAETIARLKARGLSIELLSGDRAPAVAEVAARLGIDTWQAGRSPGEKSQRLAELAEQGRSVLMVGDGLNDAPALAAASVSMSPSSAVDIAQITADMVFQGGLLAPVSEALEVARRADALVKQNFALAFFYNVVTVPLAVMGLVTPLIAAIAMSSSSLIVIANALRLSRKPR